MAHDDDNAGGAAAGDWPQHWTGGGLNGVWSYMGPDHLGTYTEDDGHECSSVISVKQWGRSGQYRCRGPRDRTPLYASPPAPAPVNAAGILAGLEGTRWAAAVAGGFVYTVRGGVVVYVDQDGDELPIADHATPGAILDAAAAGRLVQVLDRVARG